MASAIEEVIRRCTESLRGDWNLQQEVAQELRSHLEEKCAELKQQGLSPEECAASRRAVFRRAGGDWRGAVPCQFPPVAALGETPVPDPDSDGSGTGGRIVSGGELRCGRRDGSITGTRSAQSASAAGNPARHRRKTVPATPGWGRRSFFFPERRISAGGSPFSCGLYRFRQPGKSPRSGIL